ncbi:phosphotransferase [Halioglobus maricola]|nr:phosphotransferase [Halioglobus maricola]
MALPFPGHAGEISDNWLSEALGRRVLSHSVLDQHDGTTGRVALQLEYDAGERERVFLKLPPADEQQRAFVLATGMGEREARFYAELAADVPVRVPRPLYSGWESGGEHYAMLLEDLEATGCSFRNASERYSLDYVRAVLSAFAKLHGRYWETPRFAADLDWMEPPPQHPIAPVLVAQALESHADQMPPIFVEMCELYIHHTDAVHQLWHRGPHTLVHGDAHDGNMFSDAGEPGFLDWALLAKTNPMRDVGYFLAGTVQPADLADGVQDLFAYYRNALEAEGVNTPPAAEMYRDCQLHAAYVWVGTVTTLAMGDAWQPVSYVTKTLERLHLALELLQTPRALKSELIDF